MMRRMLSRRGDQVSREGIEIHLYLLRLFCDPLLHDTRLDRTDK